MKHLLQKELVADSMDTDSLFPPKIYLGMRTKEKGLAVAEINYPNKRSTLGKDSNANSK